MRRPGESPWTPYAVLCGTELWLWHRASFWQPLQPWFVKETAFFFAKAQNLRIRLAPNSWDCYAGFCVAQSFVLAAFATLVCQRNCVFLCKGTKLKNSAKPNSRTVCRFPPWYAFLPLIPAVWGFGLGLLGGQGFIGAKASLDPLCRAL